MTEEVLAFLSPRSSAFVLDGTVGGGGHARTILEASAPAGRLIGLDLDPEALAQARGTLRPFGDRVWLRQGNYAEADRLVPGDWLPLAGVLLDLGLSGWQVEQTERGFSYQQDAPLDMRMAVTGDLTAARLLNEWPEDALVRIFKGYGEEPRARTLARRVVAERKRRPFERTSQLRGLVEALVPPPSRIKVLARVSQALRIAVNDELSNLRRGLPVLLGLLEPEGRLVVISYHSLEDRIVKEYFRFLAARCVCPPGVPVCRCGKVPEGRVLTRRVRRPSPDELARNPRARSARLRAIEKLPQ